jgi:hypothetical protein
LARVSRYRDQPALLSWAIFGAAQWFDCSAIGDSGNVASRCNRRQSDVGDTIPLDPATAAQADFPPRLSAWVARIARLCPAGGRFAPCLAINTYARLGSVAEMAKLQQRLRDSKINGSVARFQNGMLIVKLRDEWNGQTLPVVYIACAIGG